MSLTLDAEKYKISATWQCPECGEEITANVIETFEVGWPLCTNCAELEMNLISFLLEYIEPYEEIGKFLKKP